MSPPLTLLSLPVDVLQQILSHLLLSPVFPGRASILRTCSTLNFIGLPLLYRVVDLTGFYTVELGRVWEIYFGDDGLFAERSRGGEEEEEGREREDGFVTRRKVEGAWVRHLLLGSVRSGNFRVKYSPSFVVGTLCLPNCSTLSLQSSSPYVDFEPALTPIISQLPIRHVLLVRRPDDDRWGGCELHHPDPYQWRLGLDSPPWPDLRSIEYIEILLYEGTASPGGTAMTHEGLALRTYPFRKLVVRLDPLRFKSAPRLYRNLFEMPDDSYPRVERIEMRVAMEIETMIRRKREESSRTGLNALELRLGPLVVFVDEDGTERRLVEA